MSTPNQPAAARSSIAGSERSPLAGASPGGPIDAGQDVSVSVYLRPAQPITPQLVADQPRGSALSREEFAATYGATDDDIAKVVGLADQYGLRVVEQDPARR